MQSLHCDGASTQNFGETGAWIFGEAPEFEAEETQNRGKETRWFIGPTDKTKGGHVGAPARDFVS